jgi:hypothetical protein
MRQLHRTDVWNRGLSNLSAENIFVMTKCLSAWENVYIMWGLSKYCSQASVKWKLNSRSCFNANSHRLSCTIIKSNQLWTGSYFHENLLEFLLVWRVTSSQLSSTLVQLLFPSDPQSYVRSKRVLHSQSWVYSRHLEPTLMASFSIIVSGLLP